MLRNGVQTAARWDAVGHQARVKGGRGRQREAGQAHQAGDEAPEEESENDGEKQTGNEAGDKATERTQSS